MEASPADVRRGFVKQGSGPGEENKNKKAEPPSCRRPGYFFNTATKILISGHGNG